MKVVLFILVIICVGLLCYVSYDGGFQDGVNAAIDMIKEKIKEMEEDDDEHIH